jgi:alpha-glucosidase
VPFGFSPPGVSTWLPQPDHWPTMTVQAQHDTSGSMLSLYRDALRLRRTLPDLHDPSFAWRGSPADVLIFDPGQTLGCVINLSDRPFPLPGHGAPLLAAALPSQGTSPRTPPAGWTAQLRSKQRIATSVARRQNPI